MTIKDWKKKNAGNFTENKTSTNVSLFNPSMKDLRDIIDTEDWDFELMEYLPFVVINDYATDADGNYTWLYLVSDSGVAFNLKPSKKHPDRLIAWSDEYSDSWELVEFIKIDYNRETEVNTFLVKIPSVEEPIELYMS